jgi:hypothetical protein
MQESLWLVLTADGSLVQLDLARNQGNRRVITVLSEATMAWITEKGNHSRPRPEKFSLSSNGHFAVIVNPWGLHGIVVNLVSGQIVKYSEDGSSLHRLFDREHREDPLCWLDTRTLAIWGYLEEDNPSPSILCIFDVISGEEQQRLSVPEGEIFFDEYLFSCSQTLGTTIWDVKTG